MISCSACASPCFTSTSNNATSADAISCHVLPMPIVSTSSEVSRKPAVSIICTGTPSICTVSRIASRVVPATEVTIATSRAASRLSKLDLPTFGCPIKTTRIPSRNRLPCFAVYSKACRFSCTRSNLSYTLVVCNNPSSSSGKSSMASISIRNSIRLAFNSLTYRENSPVNERNAERAAASDVASMRSATLSACAKSILSFKKARWVNSPGLAIRAPSRKQRFNTLFNTTGPPCPCNSSTSSPVYEFGSGKYRATPSSIISPPSSRKGEKCA